MHGLVNRALQSFLSDTYGADRWRTIARAAGLDGTGFEAMLTYDDAVTAGLLDAASEALQKPPSDLLEDLGTYLVSHPNMARLRRLLRFGGDGFVDFLHSLDDLPGRARLAVPDLDVPAMVLTERGDGLYRLECRADPRDLCHVVLGALRSMADDYGALAFVEFADQDIVGDASAKVRTIEITLHSTSFSAARSFDLSACSL